MGASTGEGLRGELDPGERLIWSGQPRQGVCPDFGLVVIVLFTVGWIGALVVVAILNSSKDKTVGTYLLVLFFALAGSLPLLVTLLFGPRSRSRTFYGLTDRRLLIVTGQFNRHVESLPLTSVTIGNVRLKKGAWGTLTVQFADFAKRCGYDRNELCMPEFANSPDAPRAMTLIQSEIAASANRQAQENSWVHAFEPRVGS